MQRISWEYLWVVVQDFAGPSTECFVVIMHGISAASKVLPVVITLSRSMVEEEASHSSGTRKLEVNTC